MLDYFKFLWYEKSTANIIFPRNTYKDFKIFYYDNLVLLKLYNSAIFKKILHYATITAHSGAPIATLQRFTFISHKISNRILFNIHSRNELTASTTLSISSIFITGDIGSESSVEWIFSVTGSERL